MPPLTPSNHKVAVYSHENGLSIVPTATLMLPNGTETRPLPSRRGRQHTAARGIPSTWLTWNWLVHDVCKPAGIRRPGVHVNRALPAEERRQHAELRRRNLRI